ncbi:MAG: hypothetical protein CMA57_02235 [Euryarchaeota archaeon]|nr:hypothetical protein [Euryarchaeota archaeon]
MKMSSDLGKMYRRNYMVKSQLRSLTEKSKALNARINNDTKIDEWAESYITRADAQIDDVSDYMNYRNLGQLAHVRRPGPSTKALPAPKLPIYGQQRQPAPAPAPAPKPPTNNPYTTPSPPPSDRDGDGVPDKNDAFPNDPTQQYDRDGDGYGDNASGNKPDEYPDDSTEWEDSDNDGYGDNYDLFGNLTDNLPQVTLGSTAGALLMLGGMGAVYGLVTYNEYKSQKKLKVGAKERLKRMAIYAGVGAGIGTLYKGIVGTGQATGYY